QGRPLGGVDGGRHGDDVDIAIAQRLGLRGVAEMDRQRQVLGLDFQRAVPTCPQLGDAVRLDVEAYSREPLAELDCQRQANIAKPNDSDARAIDRTHCRTTSVLLLARSPFLGVRLARAPALTGSGFLPAVTGRGAERLAPPGCNCARPRSARQNGMSSSKSSGPDDCGGSKSSCAGASCCQRDEPPLPRLSSICMSLATISVV